MTAFAIITNAGQLTASFQEQRKTGVSHRALMHQNGVSALWHAAEHGQNGMLNRFYGMLLTNEKTAFRTYVDRFQNKMVREGNKDGWEKDAAGKRIPTEFKFLTYENGEFRVITAENAVAQGLTVETYLECRKAFKKLAMEKLINPTKVKGERDYGFFYERNNVRDSRELYVDENKAVAQIRKLINTPNAKFSPKFKSTMVAALGTLETIAEQDIDGVSVVPTAEDIAKVRAFRDGVEAEAMANPAMIDAIAKDMDAATGAASKSAGRKAVN